MSFHPNPPFDSSAFFPPGRAGILLFSWVVYHTLALTPKLPPITMITLIMAPSDIIAALPRHDIFVILFPALTFLGFKAFRTLFFETAESQGLLVEPGVQALGNTARLA